MDRNSITSIKVRDKTIEAIDELLRFLETKYLVIPTSKKLKDDAGFYYLFVSISPR
jgi:hypothetical protein